MSNLCSADARRISPRRSGLSCKTVGADSSVFLGGLLLVVFLVGACGGRDAREPADRAGVSLRGNESKTSVSRQETERPPAPDARVGEQPKVSLQQMEEMRAAITEMVVEGGELGMDFGTPWRRGEGESEAERARPTGATVEVDGPDVVLLVVDTERADQTSLYGAPIETTPFLERLAVEGVTFRRVFSPSSWTAPVMASLFTGIYPSEHGIEDGVVSNFDKSKVLGQQVLHESARTMAELLGEAGYSTYGISTNHHLSARFGFAQGFDTFVGKRFYFDLLPSVAVEALAARFREPGRRFIWVHYMAPHFPYRAMQPWFGRWNRTPYGSLLDASWEVVQRYYRRQEELGEDSTVDVGHIDALYSMARATAETLPFLAYGMRAESVARDGDLVRFMRTAYRSEVRSADAAMERDLETLGVGADALVIATADHGEELFERRWFGHRHSLFQELIHVPLVMRLPGRRHAGEVVEEPVSLVDVLPTVLGLLDIEPPSGLSGESLVPLLEGARLPPRPLVSETKYGDYEMRALIEYPWKLVYNSTTGTGRLYNLADDPRELRDRVADEPRRAAAMRERLRRWGADHGPRWQAAPPAPLSMEEREQLRALGYM
jgi:choline-sulfatase